jgi:hypothetical protein
MLALVDVAWLSLIPAVSGRGDTIPGGAPSFSLRGNGDLKDGHSFFLARASFVTLPFSALLLLSSRLSPSSSSLLQAGGGGEKTLCELGLLDAAAVATRADAILGEDIGAALTDCLNPSSSPPIICQSIKSPVYEHVSRIT